VDGKMDWISCKKNRLVKEIKTDNNLIISLINSSFNKIKTQETIKLNKETAASKISLAYDSLRELLETVAILKGYKIYNHECYYCFLKERLNESLIADEFNKFRRIMNDINYYGKEMDINETKRIIKGIIELIQKIKHLNILKINEK
jgi:hypothetical protein